MTLYLIRGLPGSGKTTLARKLVGENYFEADQYFTNDRGEYKYDRSQLADAHSDCQERVEKAMSEAQVIAVSNTFSQRWEMEPYIRMAKRHGYTVVEITLSGQLFPNVHDVPREKIDIMRARWEK